MVFQNWYQIFFFIVLIEYENLFQVNGDSKAEKKDSTGSVSETNKVICCARHEKLVSIGVGISGETIKVDAGYCKNYCPRQFYDDPGDPSRPAVTKCKPNMNCRPRTSRIDRVSTIKGFQSVEVVETCDCLPVHTCRRDPYSQILHVGTPYQVEIDVGVCVGWCKINSCRASRNASISVRGPNGEEVYQVIDRCSCASSCYRMDHIETILDFSRIEIKDNMKIADVRPNVKEINVGKCIGKCTNSTTESCLLRDKRNPLKCLAGLYKENNCIPVKFRVHEYRTRRGLKREIIQIAQCACV
ncbi:hypothetical protein TKK_0002291 [Trichogramma kaykai]